MLAAARLEQTGATLRAYVSVDRRLAAVLEYADQLRPDLAGLLGALEASGIRRVACCRATTRRSRARSPSRVGIEEAYGDLMPDDKAQFIERMRAEGGVVMMIGDGINDAPALSTADVGVALAAHGGGIAAEAADVIVLVDSLSRVSETKLIADRTMRIARQSIRVGLGLSGIAMLVAAFGGLDADRRRGAAGSDRCRRDPQRAADVGDARVRAAQGRRWRRAARYCGDAQRHTTSRRLRRRDDHEPSKSAIVVDPSA